MKKRFLLDSDFTNLIGALQHDLEGGIAEAVRECADNVTTYLVCSGAGTYYFPTQAGVTAPWMRTLLDKHAHKKDPLGMLLAALRAAGKETFITFRMNDVHNPNAGDQWNMPKIRRESPDCIVDPEAVKAGKGGWMAYCLDYSQARVREYILASVKEMLDRYGDTLDGLQLDWMRFPRHISGTPDEVWQKRGCLTELTAAVRGMINDSGKKILLTARVPTSIAGCRYVGIDVAEQTKQGLLDFLVAAPFLITDFGLPLAELRETISGQPVPLYAGIEFGHSTQCHCPESLRAAATALYDAGADGLYLFNFPCWLEYLAARPYHWLKGLDDPATAAEKPLLFSVPHSRRRTPQVDLPKQLPCPLRADGRVELRLPLPGKALPAWRALLLVHSGGDITIAVNGRDFAEDPASRRAELFVEHIEQDCPQQYRPRNEDCRVFRVDAGALVSGNNTITIANNASRDLELKRVNLGLW